MRCYVVAVSESASPGAPGAQLCSTLRKYVKIVRLSLPAAHVLCSHYAGDVMQDIQTCLTTCCCRDLVKAACTCTSDLLHTNHDKACLGTCTGTIFKAVQQLVCVQLIKQQQLLLPWQSSHGVHY